VKVFEGEKLRRLGHHLRMQEQNPCRKLTLHKPEGAGAISRLTIRWLNLVEEDFKIMGFSNLR
jgi:hypothetical protein